MRARLVKEDIEFKRTGDPLSSMGLGGFSFKTLNPGAILQATRFFGVTKTGTLGGISRAIRVNKDNYFLVTGVEPGSTPKKKIISWIKTYHEDKIYEAREAFKEGGAKAIPWYGFARGFFDNISERQFDYRLKVIEKGFPMSESHFQRGGDPYKRLGIGKRTWENLSRGDVLKPLKEFKVKGGRYETALHFVSPSTQSAITLYEEDFLVVDKVQHNVEVATSGGRRAPVWKQGIRVKFIRCWDMDAVRDTLEEQAADREVTKQKPLEGTIQQFERRMEILQNI